MKNIHITGIKKNLVPRVIVNGYHIYLAFVHETSKKPLRYYDFLHGNLTEDWAPYESEDYVYKLSPSTYFELNYKLMSRGTKYNLMKKRHEYNRRKYGKIRSSNNTV